MNTDKIPKRFIYETVEDFEASVKAKVTADGLNSMVRHLRSGAKNVSGIHPFRYGEDSYKAAFIALLNQAKKLGFIYDKKAFSPFHKPDLAL